MSDHNNPLTKAERTQHRSATGQVNWVAGISRPGISSSVCRASTKFKIIRNVKSTKSCIKFSCLDLKLFTDVSFDNLPHGGSQGGQIIVITDGNNNSCPLYWNSSKIKRAVLSTIAAETQSLVDGCDVAIYINNMLSELLHTKPNITYLLVLLPTPTIKFFMMLYTV